MNPQGRRPPRGTAALAVLSLVCAGLALRPAGSGAAVDSTTRPLWTPDRLPALLAEAQGTVDLGRAVDDLLGGPGVRSCLAVSEGDRPVLLRRPDDALAPASTQKILLAVAALAVLGPDFRYETKLVSDAEPRDGTVGSLWLVGSGDPELASPEYIGWLADKPRYLLHPATPLAALAAGLAGAGVHAVTGAIAGDDSRYDRLRAVPTWKPGYIAENEVGPLGALLVNRGFSRYEPPEQRAADPALHAAGELSRLAQAIGISVGGPATSGVAPRQAAVTVATVRSAPLSDIVAGMLRESDNTAAELVTKELGLARAHVGSTAAGTKALTDALAGAHLPTTGLRLGDGSGLEITNRVSCSLLAAALRRPARPGVPPLTDLLAVAGRTGTLALRLNNTPLDGKLRAKTGSLNGVTGLAGYVDGRRALSFAFLANGPLSDAAGRLLQDRLVALLAAYPGPQPRL